MTAMVGDFGEGMERLLAALLLLLLLMMLLVIGPLGRSEEMIEGLGDSELYPF